MGWTSRALERLVWLEIEIPGFVAISGDMAIDDGTRDGIVGSPSGFMRTDIGMT